MEKLTKDEMEKIISVVGAEVSGSFTSPKPGVVNISKLTVVDPRDQVNSTTGETTHFNAWVRVDFVTGDNKKTPAGSCSLRSLLISPNITWTKDTQEERIQALCATPLEWQFIEPRTSKSGNPYKVAHVKDITL